MAIALEPPPDLYGPTAAVATRIEDGTGEQHDLVLSFTQVQGAWKLNVPAVAIRRYANSLGLTAAP